MTTITALPSPQIHQRIDELTQLLIECVADGASVSFMWPLTTEKAQAFWLGVAQSVARGERLLLVSLTQQDELSGTVQLILDQPENQPHRADVAKLLVSPRARRMGIAQRLMTALETHAVDSGKSVLVLDTATGSGAERFYQQAGWQRVGTIPHYALMPDGASCSTTYFYKHLNTQ